MRLPPNYGSITKLKGNRRRPYMVRITTGKIVDFEKKTAYNKQTVLGYYATRKEAMQALSEYNAAPYNLDRTRVTVGEIWEQIKGKVDVSDDRMKKYESNFRRYIGPVANSRIADVKAGALQNLIDAIPYGYSVQAITRAVLHHIYTYAAQNDIIPQNYVDFVKIEPAEVKIERSLYTPQEVSMLWTEADRPQIALTLLLLYEGARIKELRDMPKNAVDLTENTLDIREGKNAQSARKIPIHDRVRPLVVDAMKTKGDRLFDLSKNQYDYFVRENLSHKPYDTRHTFASEANKIGLPKLSIQRIMGHKPESVLEQAYIHLTMDELREAINKIEY